MCLACRCAPGQAYGCISDAPAPCGPCVYARGLQLVFGYPTSQCHRFLLSSCIVCARPNPTLSVTTAPASLVHFARLRRSKRSHFEPSISHRQQRHQHINGVYGEPHMSERAPPYILSARTRRTATDGLFTICGFFNMYQNHVC